MTEQEKQVWYDALKERANQPDTYAVTGGMRVAELGDGWARGELLLEERHRNPMGIVHGGVYYTLMDQLAGMATAATGRGGVTLDANVSYLKSARAGETVRCKLEAVHIGKSVAVYEAKCFGEDGALQATGTFHLFFLKPVETMTGVAE